ncbi:hypothetical protein C8J55DRAFT_504191 [Lentinula edodes]|uniref:Secreted protein n=1 Tax=Lentinula lateritia TaxID=40482 RepID=A0A9W9DY55_9AGAR|nr:hypothetical protein C8J55DRAFT_504191 [Lentinula edodes]
MLMYIAFVGSSLLFIVHRESEETSGHVEEFKMWACRYFGVACRISHSPIYENHSNISTVVKYYWCACIYAL